MREGQTPQGNWFFWATLYGPFQVETFGTNRRQKDLLLEVRRVREHLQYFHLAQNSCEFHD